MIQSIETNQSLTVQALAWLAMEARTIDAGDANRLEGLAELINRDWVRDQRGV